MIALKRDTLGYQGASLLLTASSQPQITAMALQCSDVYLDTHWPGLAQGCWLAATLALGWLIKRSVLPLHPHRLLFYCLRISSVCVGALTEREGAYIRAKGP